MWERILIDPMVKYSWQGTNGAEIRQGVRSATMLSSSDGRESFEINRNITDDFSSGVYWTELKLVPEAQLRVKLAGEGLSYGINVNFFNGRRTAALISDAISKHRKMISQNVECWIETKLGFEKELRDLVENFGVPFDRTDMYHNNRLDRLIYKINVASSGDPGNLEFDHKYAKGLESEEALIVDEIKRLTATRDQYIGRESVAAVSGVQRAKIPFGRRLETISNLPLSKAETASLKPYLISVVESLPPLGPPFQPNKTYADSIAAL
jgi:hypothetical protein